MSESTAAVSGSEKMQRELRLIAEARALFREGVARLILASTGNSPASIEAAVSLIAGLLDAVDDVADEARRDNEALRCLLEKCTGWPIRYYAFQRDRKTQSDELLRLGFGKRCPLNISVALMDSPGTRWAFKYWRFRQEVLDAHRSLRIDRFAKECGMSPVAVVTALKLADLSRDKAVLKEWKIAAIAHFEEKYPGQKFASHSNWKEIKGGANKIRELIEVGFANIAPRQLG